MAGQKFKGNKDVTVFLDNLNHPLRKEIEQLRHLILHANAALSENIKWNAPNYTHSGADRITMKILPPKQVQLIFHRGAKVLKPPAHRLIGDRPGLLVWKANDRAVATFKTSTDIENAGSDLKEIIKEWLEATNS